MKVFYCLLVSLLCFSAVHAKLVDGYIVTLKGDTLHMKIKVPGGLGNNAWEEVEATDTANNIFTYTPADIRAYGHRLKEHDYVYVSKPTKKNKSLFLEPVIIGPNASLYEYVLSNGGGYGSPEERYTFEKADGSHLFMNNYAALDKFISELKTFFKEYPEVQKLIDSRFRARRKIQTDISDILVAVNALPAHQP